RSHRADQTLVLKGLSGTEPSYVPSLRHPRNLSCSCFVPYTERLNNMGKQENLKGDLAIRPIFHHDESRIEAHIFVAFLAYCLQITLTRRLHALAPGLTARSALEKFAAVQMIDVHLPTTDGREIVLTRYTQPEPDLQLLISRLKLRLPAQPPPKITAAALAQNTLRSEDLRA